MQSSAFSLSNTISLTKPRRPLNPRSLFRFNPISTPSPPKSFGYGVSASSSSRLPSMCISFSSSSSSSPPPRLHGWISAPPLVPQRESDGFEVRAASVPESSDGESEKSKFEDIVVLKASKSTEKT